MKKILVPTDFSNNSRHALHVAATIAQKAGAKIELLHTNTVMAYAPPLPEYAIFDQPDMAQYYEMAADELFNLKRDVVENPAFKDISIETRIEEGFLYNTLRRIAEEDKVDLIVMGTKGASGATEFFVGSNTEKVIRTSCCPILAVPENSGEFDVKEVLMATTLRPDQSIAFDALAKWQELFPFKVKVLYLNNPAGFDTNDQIEKAAIDFAAKSWLKNISTFVSGNTFNEESSILQFAGEHKIGMIAMATHQRKGLSHLLFGSLTEDTVNHSNIPVLCIPVK
ncbi:MAG: universal stress protein [Lewinellaceae bacterium]|nr:universal stress protein [Lewinellaceae bacterium]